MSRKIGDGKICAAIFGTIKPLRQWAEEYDLPYKIVYERYRKGIIGEELIKPERTDLLTRAAVRRLWHGRWIYRNELTKRQRKPWIYRRNPLTRWVFAESPECSTKWVFVEKHA